MFINDKPKMKQENNLIKLLEKSKEVLPSKLLFKYVTLNEINSKFKKEIEKIQEFEKVLTFGKIVRKSFIKSHSLNGPGENYKFIGYFIEDEEKKDKNKKKEFSIKKVEEYTNLISAFDGKIIVENNLISKNEKFENLLKFEQTEKEKEDEQEEEFFKEKSSMIGRNLGKDYKINILNSSLNDLRDNNYKVIKTENTITGVEISNIQNSNPQSKKESPRSSLNLEILSKENSNKPRCFTDLAINHTFDYSSVEEVDKSDKSPLSDNSSNNKVLRKINLNPYYNFDLIKKYFLYQLKKSFLQTKKFVMNNAVHGHIKSDDGKNPNYHEIFSNYSQITTTTVSSHIKYEDKNVQINNYFISKNKLLGKGGFSSVYLCKSLTDQREYVRIILNALNF